MALLSAGLSLGVIVLDVAFIALILSRNPRGRTSRAYLLLMLSFIVWNLGEALVRLFPDAPREQLLLWLKIEWTGIVLLPGTILFFALTYPEASRILRHAWAFPLVFLPSAAFIALIWTDAGLTQGVVQGPLGPEFGTGPLYPPSFAVFVSWLVMANVRLGREAYLKRREPEGRAAILVFIGLAHTNALGILTDAMFPLFSGYVRSGVGSIYNLDFAAFVAYAIYRYRFLVLEAAKETTYPVDRGFPLKDGLAQLILCEDKAPAYSGFRTLAARLPAICVTATPPRVLVHRYQLDRTPILWVTKLQGQPWGLKPTELKFEGLQALVHALRDSPSTAILVDDVDYVALSVGFPDTLALLKNLYDRCSQVGATLVVPLNPASLDPREVALLGQIFDHTERVPHRPATSVADPSSALAIGSRAWYWTVLGKTKIDGGTLVVTQLHPAKYRSSVGAPDLEIMWLSDSLENSAVSPVGLDLGLGRAVKRWMGSHPNGSVLLEGLEYLFTVNTLQEVVELVKGLVDLASARGIRIVFGIRAEAVNPRALALLSQRCEVTLVEKEVAGEID